jgi:hypothetical protein
VKLDSGGDRRNVPHQERALRNVVCLIHWVLFVSPPEFRDVVTTLPKELVRRQNDPRVEVGDVPSRKYGNT